MKCGKKLKLQSDSGFGSLNIDTALVRENTNKQNIFIFTKHSYDENVKLNTIF